MVEGGLFPYEATVGGGWRLLRLTSLDENMPCEPLELNIPTLAVVGAGGALPLDLRESGGGLSVVNCPEWMESGGGESARVCS